MHLKRSAIFFGFVLGFSVPATHAQTQAQGDASAQGNAAVHADKQGAQATGSGSAAGSAQAGHQSAALADGTTMNAALTHPVDAKKNKPGDPVSAKTTQSTKSNGQVVIPKGSKLEGHVTEAKARGKGDAESSLGIAWDRAILKDGQEVPLNAGIQALASAQSSASAAAPMEEDSLGMGAGAAGGARAAGGGALSGVRGTAGGAVSGVGGAAGSAGSVAGSATSGVSGAAGAAGGAVGSTANFAGATRATVGGLNSSGQLMSNSQGVFGLSGLALQTAAATNAQGSLVTSTTRNVRLDSGTQMILVASGSAQPQAANR
jgi:hypothetical protein